MPCARQLSYSEHAPHARTSSQASRMVGGDSCYRARVRNRVRDLLREPRMQMPGRLSRRRWRVRLRVGGLAATAAECRELQPGRPLSQDRQSAE